MILSPDHFMYSSDGEYLYSPTREAAAWKETLSKVGSLLKENRFKKVIVLIGLPGTGKTAWANDHTHLDDTLILDANFCTVMNRIKLFDVVKPFNVPVEGICFPVVDLSGSLPKSSKTMPEDAYNRLVTHFAHNPPSQKEGFQSIKFLLVPPRSAGW